ncbi:MAG: hypothetical protein R2845_02340 [Thermomicrobiales bacterium]
MSNKPVLAIGEILIDLIVGDDAPSLETANTFNARAGSAPANGSCGGSSQDSPLRSGQRDQG